MVLFQNPVKLRSDTLFNTHLGVNFLKHKHAKILVLCAFWLKEKCLFTGGQKNFGH